MKSDFTNNRNLSVYEFHDWTIRWKEGVTYENGKFIMFQAEGDKPLQMKELPANKQKLSLFAGQGWHHYILDRLEEFAMQSSPTLIHLAFPAHLNHYPFLLKKEWSRGNLLRLSLSFNSWLASLLAGKIQLTYDVTKKKLLDFTGPSNVYDENGKLQHVHIVYP